MSASAADVQAYVALRRAPYGTNRVVMANAPDCARTVKRLLYCSDRFRVVQKPGRCLTTKAAGMYEFQLARSGGSVPCTLSMQQLAHEHRRTPSPTYRYSGSRRKLPTERWRKQKNCLPAPPAQQLSGPQSTAVDIPPAKASHLPYKAEPQKMSRSLARTCSDGAPSKVTAEDPEDKTASAQSVLHETFSTRNRAATTRPRGQALPTEAANVNLLSDPKAEMGLVDDLEGDIPLDFCAELSALLPTQVQSLPLMNEAEEALSEQLLNFREWETSFGWS
ncbi:hypothetical protein MMPV_009333 [Pyropia vietnamensis]